MRKARPPKARVRQVSRAEQIAVGTLTAIAHGPYAKKHSHTPACTICLCPWHAGHRPECPVGLATRALEMIATLERLSAG